MEMSEVEKWVVDGGQGSRVRVELLDGRMKIGFLLKNVRGGIASYTVQNIPPPGKGGSAVNAYELLTELRAEDIANIVPEKRA